MNAKWASVIVVGVVLAVLSTQVTAQPWGVGRGQGVGMGGQGPGFIRRGMGPGGPQRGPGAWGPMGAGPGARRGWGSQGPGQLGPGLQIGCRLGLTDDQVRKIRDIVEQNRSRMREAIREVLTEEQAKQFDQMHERAGQLGLRRGGPAQQGGPGGPAGPRFQQGPGSGARVGPQGQGPRQQPFRGGPGAGRGMGPQGRIAPPDTSQTPPGGGQSTQPGPLPNRGMPPIERMFDEADTDNDGALTKEEIRAFHEGMGTRPGWRRQ